jgi:hypothetical protein
MVAEDLFCRTPGPAVARWRHLRQLQALRLERCDRDHKDGGPPDDADRPRSRSSGRLCGITRRRLSNRRFRLPGLHLGSCPAHRGTGDIGRASGPTGQGQATAEALRRAASGMPQNTGPAAPARRRPRAAACRAIGRSPTKSDLVGWSFKCSPNATALEVRSALISA